VRDDDRNKLGERQLKPIDYDEAVRKGKTIIAELSGKQWALGDLAAQVAKAYGENRLEQFSQDISFPGASCTLGRYRDVCRAFPKNRGRPRFFASAQILATHDDRFDIVRRNPAISKAEAREEMRKWRAEHPNANNHDDDGHLEGDDDTGATSGANTSTPAKAKGAKARGTRKPMADEEARLNEVRRVFNIVAKLANEVIDPVTDVRREEQSDLLKVVEPRLVKEVRKGGKALMDLADWLDELFDAAAEKLKQDGHIQTSPKPVPVPPEVRA
jgi:hypothetical protein